MLNNQEIFADNAAPFNSIKLISAGNDGCVKKQIVDIASQTVQKESHISAQSTKSVTMVTIVKQGKYISITSIAMNNDTHTLFVADYNDIITQFQKEDSSLNYYPTRTLHSNYINSISLSNSKMLLLIACGDCTLRVWDLQNGAQPTCLNVERKEHQSSICSCSWNGEDTLFASGGLQGGVVVWSPPQSIYNTSNHFIAKCKFKAEGDNFSWISYLKFQENGLDLFASYCSSELIRLWSINENELLDNKSTHQQNVTLPLIQQPKLQSEKLKRKIYSFDVRGNMLVVGVNEEILSLSADSLQLMADAVKFEKVHKDYKICSLVFSQDGKYVVSGNDGSVAIFDSKSGKCVKLINNACSTWGSPVVFEI